ncbi:hypothetical protein [Microbulbifer sp. ALW1]|uniref:DUF7710 domain-containing protein n=1 Tax=Microbulbifer sp. (strain ALW1) TaxID=1516059 RepID=UPI001357DAA6|nr:hypothetical protein [Microbulbifer sp. ALW1]
MEDKIYVFHGSGAQFCSAVFNCRDKAEEWIAKNTLSGMLTAYPLNQGVYDWALAKEYFTPKKDYHKESKFIGSFTSASQEHYHYENGENS